MPIERSPIKNTEPPTKKRVMDNLSGDSNLGFTSQNQQLQNQLQLQNQQLQNQQVHNQQIQNQQAQNPVNPVLAEAPPWMNLFVERIEEKIELKNNQIMHEIQDAVGEITTMKLHLEFETNERKELEKRVNSQESNSNIIQQQTKNMTERMIRMEKEQKSMNIIVMGIEETTDESKQFLSTKVEKLLQRNLEIFDIKPVDSFRFGRKTTTNPRPVKVILRRKNSRFLVKQKI